jgi:hypothetical protein
MFSFQNYQLFLLVLNERSIHIDKEEKGLRKWH